MYLLLMGTYMGFGWLRGSLGGRYKLYSSSAFLGGPTAIISSSISGCLAPEKSLVNTP